MGNLVLKKRKEKCEEKAVLNDNHLTITRKETKHKERLKTPYSIAMSMVLAPDATSLVIGVVSAELYSSGIFVSGPDGGADCPPPPAYAASSAELCC
jgi:hypothetical protein